MNPNFSERPTGRSSRAILSGVLAAALLAAGAATAAPAAKAPKGDAAAGRKAFALRCAACHGAEGAGSPMAPALARAYGARAASGAYGKYSAALKASHLSWTAANLDSYLAAPGKRVPGTLMMISVPDAADRANLVAYLASLKAHGSAKN